jgi:hypothetical protein
MGIQQQLYGCCVAFLSRRVQDCQAACTSSIHCCTCIQQDLRNSCVAIAGCCM